MKGLAKLIAPYLTAILSAIGVYTTSQTKIAMLEYRCERMETEQGGIKEDVKGIKDLLYSIDMKLNGIGLYIDKAHNAITDNTKRGILFGIVKKYAMEDYVVWIVGSGDSVSETILDWYANSHIALLSNAAVDATLIAYANSIKTATNHISIDANQNTMSVQDVKDANALLNAGVFLELWTIDIQADYEAYKPYVSAITSNKLSEKIIKDLPV